MTRTRAIIFDMAYAGQSDAFMIAEISKMVLGCRIHEMNKKLPEPRIKLYE
jgi:hypothetical protein